MRHCLSIPMGKDSLNSAAFERAKANLRGGLVCRQNHPVVVCAFLLLAFASFNLLWACGVLARLVDAVQNKTCLHTLQTTYCEIQMGRSVSMHICASCARRGARAFAPLSPKSESRATGRIFAACSMVTAIGCYRALVCSLLCYLSVFFFGMSTRRADKRT